LHQLQRSCVQQLYVFVDEPKQEGFDLLVGVEAREVVTVDEALIKVDALFVQAQIAGELLDGERNAVESLRDFSYQWFRGVLDTCVFEALAEELDGVILREAPVQGFFYIAEAMMAFGCGMERMAGEEEKLRFMMGFAPIAEQCAELCCLFRRCVWGEDVAFSTTSQTLPAWRRKSKKSAGSSPAAETAGATREWNRARFRGSR